MNNIIEQHGRNWMYKEVEQVLTELNKQSHKKVSLYSIELYDINNELIAGEIGHLCGSIYTSLTVLVIKKCRNFTMFKFSYIIKK